MKGKTSLLSLVIAYVIAHYHKRLVRLTCHLFKIEKSCYLPPSNAKEWTYDLGAYLADLILLPELYQVIRIITSRNVHQLSDEDKYIAQSYFGQSVDLRYVIIYPNMSRWVRAKALAYVTFNSINYYRHISTPILLHELVHVWQYQQYGSMYIFRALSAQRSKEGYDYGGAEMLYNDMLEQKRFTDYNFEQQGSIIEDYALLSLSPHQHYSPLISATYEYFLSQLKDT